MRLISFWYLTLLCLLPMAAYADSPLTSTPFYTAYMDIKVIKDHESAERISAEGFQFLDGNAPADQKAAFVNALGWGKMQFVNSYREHLGKKYGLPTAFFDSILVYKGDEPETLPGTEKLTQDELMCLGYMQAMGNYFEPLKGHYCAYLAFNRGVHRSQAMVYGLIVAQYNLDRNWCYVYQVMEYCRDQPGIELDDFRDEAMTIIFDYINLYQSECEEEPVYEEEETPFGLVQPKPDYYYLYDSIQANKGKKNFADLVIEEIIRPEYFEEYQGTKVKVIIRNTGSSSSFPALAKMSEVDLSLAEAKRLGLKGDVLQYAAELDNRGDDPGADDPYFESWTYIPTIEPGKRYVIEFVVLGYWIYDPNCEFKVELDTEKNITEPNEKNNVMFFVEGG